MTVRVVGKDGKAYLVSTMRYIERGYEELWETAVFEGGGCLTLSKKQRYTFWAFDAHMAQQVHAGAVWEVENEPTQSWIMSSNQVAEDRRSAIESFDKPINPFGSSADDSSEDFSDDS
jgi:hypothetical protein